MYRTLLLFSVAILLPCLAPADEQTKPDKDDLATDLNKPTSPARPAPKWLKWQDLGKQDKRLAGYRAPQGITVEIVADAPTIINPVGMAFMEDGTPLVIEWSHDDNPKFAEESFKFKDGSTRKVRVMKKRKKDVIKSLSSSKKDGIYDTAKVILEDELPSSVMPYEGWLYVAGRGSVRRYKQSKADGPYDSMEYVARGFGGVAQHQVSGLTIGPDGWLYISCGDGDNIVEGSDGSRATVLRTGAIFRCKPDGSKLHTFAMGFRNPYRGVAFDLGGLCFHLDNDGGGADRFIGCRLLHVTDGSDFGWRLAQGANSKADLDRAAAFGEKPGKLPGLLKTGKGSPAGLLIYRDTQLPQEYRGLLYYPDAARRLIRAYAVEARGASFQVVEEFELLSAGKDELFRPCQMLTGPDGAIYVVDWRTNSTGGGRLSGDGKNGRIYRIRWSGTKEQPALELRSMDSLAKIAKLEDAKLIEELSHLDASVREQVRRELVKRGDKNRAALIKLLNNGDARLVARINALGALQSMYDGSVQKAILKALADGDDELKRLAAEALGLCAKKGDTAVQDALLKAVSEEDATVRRAVFLAMGRVAGPGAADSLSTALSFDEGKDVVLRDGIIRGLELLGKEGMTALMSLADSGVQQDTDRVVEAFLAMRSREAFLTLPSILKHMHVSAAQRAELIRSCVNYQLEPPVSVDPIVDYIAKQKKETTAVKKALLTLLGTPGITSGKTSDEWSKGMVMDDNEDLVIAAIVALGVRSEGAVHVGKLLAAKKLPKALTAALIAAMRKHADNKEAAKLLAELGETK